LHVAQIIFLPAPAGLDAAGVFERWPSLADIPQAAASSGIRVSVIQAATHEERVTRHGIDYHFVDISGTKAVIDRGHRFARLLNDIKADVLHVHGLGFAEEAFAVAHYLPTLPILFQDHADRPPRWWRRPLRRVSLLLPSNWGNHSLAPACLGHRCRCLPFRNPAAALRSVIAHSRVRKQGFMAIPAWYG
jgi:hypothetical protein